MQQNILIENKTHTHTLRFAQIGNIKFRTHHQQYSGNAAACVCNVRFVYVCKILFYFIRYARMK